MQISDVNDSENLSKKFVNQINSDKSNEKYDVIQKFLKVNWESLADFFTKMANV